MRARVMARLLLASLSFAAPATAAWKAGNADVATAAKEARIAGALAAVDAIDATLIRDDHGGFAALLADDLAVNNPQNGVSVRGHTARRNAAGQISYTRYDRVIDYAGLRGDLVVLMGEEIVVPKQADGVGGREVHRRFTDIWKPVDGLWKLTARQATIITRP